MDGKMYIINITNRIEKISNYLIKFIAVCLLITSFFTTSREIIFSILKLLLSVIAISSFSLSIQGVYKNEFLKASVHFLLTIIAVYGVLFYF